ncbi:MAG: class I SAM-dependent methyltransferase [Helicobacter sp.]|nr:class I SAM-dependent methyltransferase [Helicobacter sp.]
MEFEKIVEIIESRREFLKKSDEEILVRDFGAGKPEDNRTKEQMEEGVEVRIPLKNLASIGVKREKAEQIFNIFQRLNPKNILELGACCGFSSAYFSYFAKDSRIITLEGSENLAKIARENHRFFGVKNVEVRVGRFDLSLPLVLKEYSPFDFVFIDGHHNKEATLGYFKQILPFVKTLGGGGVMLFDDIAWSDGMREAWSEILSSRAHKKAEDFGWMGALWL